MNSSLTIALAAVILLTGAVFACYGRSGEASRRMRLQVSVFTALMLGASVGVYASIGHFHDWSDQRVDDTKDHRLAAKITEGRRAVQNLPFDVNAKIELASNYMAGGMFPEAVQTLEEALKQTGPRADIYGFQANALYYRDGRKISAETREALDRALSLDPYEVQSTMLIAQDAFFAGRYQDAIDGWEKLLANNADPSKARALRNAIANAEIRLAQEKNR